MRTAQDNLWLDTHYEAGSALSGDHETDVAIIGGGVTGLSSAYFIKQRFPKKRVMVLESEYIGYGSSGRNLGLTSSVLGNNVLPILKNRGIENTRRFYRLSLNAISLVKQLVKEHRIDCGYEDTGVLDIVQTNRELRLLDKKAKAYESIGVEFTWLDSAKAQDRFQGTKILAALYLPEDKIFDPARLVRGLARAAKSLGVEVYEHSRCTHVEPGPTISLYTSLARVRANDIVVATNAYSNPLGLFRYKVVPFYTYNIATEPLTQVQLDALGWPHREPVKNQKYLFWTIRLTSDNRVALNDANPLYFYDIDRDYSYWPKVLRLHCELLTRVFPCLKGVKVTHQWGGRLGITLDFLPSIGCRGKQRNIYYSMGYNGHGVAFACLAGKMIAELMAGERTELTDHPLINKSIFGVPSASLTYLGSNGLIKYFKLYDRWLDMGS